jgi:hypothetical protein
MTKDYRSLEHKIRDVVSEASMNRNTDLRRKVVNVGRPDTAPSNFDPKSKLAKQGEIKTKIIDEEQVDEANMAKKAGEFHYGNPDELHAHLKRNHKAGDQDAVHRVLKGAPTSSLQKLHAKLKPQEGERQQHRDPELFHLSIGGELKKRGVKEDYIPEAKDDEDKDDKNKKADADDKDDDDKKKSKAGASKAEDEFTGGKTEVDLEPKTNDKINIDSNDNSKKTKKVTKEETMLRSDNKFGLPQDLIDAVTEALKGGQKKLDVAEPKGKLTAADFKKLRKEEAVEEGNIPANYAASHKDVRAQMDKERETFAAAKKERETKLKAKPQYDKARPAFTTKEEFELDEAVKTGNEGHGYHGEAHHAAKGEDKMAEAGKAYAKAHSLVKKHAADHLKGAKNPNVMVKHYLDSKHGRHLYGNENNAAYVKKDFGHFAKKYDAKMHEEVEQLDEISDKLKNSYIVRSKEQGYMANRMRMSPVVDKQTSDRASKIYNKRRRGQDLYDRSIERAKKEEVEQIDEISARKAMDYSTKSAANVGSGKSGDKEDKRIAGQKMADEKYRKMQGKSSSAKVAATEEVQLSDAEIARLEEIAKGL